VTASSPITCVVADKVFVGFILRAAPRGLKPSTTADPGMPPAGVAMSGRAPRREGNRIEGEIVAAHRGIGTHAERYPLSRSSRFRGSGHDLVPWRVWARLLERVRR
jgi:hypothetical protein